MPGQVDEVKSKTDIVSVIGEHVDLKKAGSNYKGLCPFHSEKTPSFMVSPEMQIYKCFGCGEGGDVIAFLQEYEGMEFYEALKHLADKAGIKLKPIQGKKYSRKEELYKINSLAQKFYTYILHNHKTGKPVLKYLKEQRGLKMRSIKEFKLGYSPNVPFALKRYADKKDVSIADLQEAGIVYKRNGKAFDRFRGRVIFPLQDHRGNIAGFAGRVLPGNDKLAKYINTPETPVYHKSYMLYGLYTTRRDIKQKDRAIITEGELDMISTWQIGIENVVALKGSAFTREQVNLLSRYTKNIILALDADLAGDAAAKRGIKLAQEQGFEIRIAELEGYKDPDDAARENPEALRKAIKDAKNVWDYLIDSIFDSYDVEKGLDKAKISKEVVPVLASILDDIVQAHYVDLVAKRLSVPVEAVSRQVASAKTSAPREAEADGIDTEQRSAKTRRELMEEHLLIAGFRSDPDKLLKQKALLTTSFAKRMLQELGLYLKNNDYDLGRFAEQLPEELRDGFSTIVLKQFEGIDDDRRNVWQREFDALVHEIRLSDVKAELENAADKIKKFEKDNKKDQLKELEKRYRKLTRLRTELEEEDYKRIIQY